MRNDVGKSHHQVWREGKRLFTVLNDVITVDNFPPNKFTHTLVLSLRSMPSSAVVWINSIESHWRGRNLHISPLLMKKFPIFFSRSNQLQTMNHLLLIMRLTTILIIIINHLHSLGMAIILVIDPWIVRTNQDWLIACIIRTLESKLDIEVTLHLLEEQALEMNKKKSRCNIPNSHLITTMIIANLMWISMTINIMITWKCIGECLFMPLNCNLIWWG